MKKILLSLLSSVLFLSSYAQGTTQGLAVKHDFYRDAELRNKVEEENRATNEANREVIKNAYKKVQDIYKYQASHPDVADGWQKALATDGDTFLNGRNVFVSNGIVTKYINGEGKELPVSSGGKIIDAKTVIAIGDNLIMELYFGFKIE